MFICGNVTLQITDAGSVRLVVPKRQFNRITELYGNITNSLKLVEIIRLDKIGARKMSSIQAEVGEPQLAGSKGRDYGAEILALLKDEPANGIALRSRLHLSSKQTDEDSLYGVLKSLEDTGKIEWYPISETDGVWRVKKGVL